MTKEKGEKIRFIYGVFFALFTLLVGVLFIVQVWSIYRSAPQSPYTVENISKHFHKIAIPVWLWIAAVVGNIALAVILPETEKRPKAQADVKTVLERTKKRLPKGERAQAAIVAEASAQERYRRIVAIVCLCVTLVFGVVSLLLLLGVVYVPLLKFGFFAKHDGVADKLVQVTVLSVLALTACCVSVWLFHRSRTKEVQAYRDIIARDKQPKKELTEEEQLQEQWGKAVRMTACNQLFDLNIPQEEIDEEIQKAMGIWVDPKEKKAKEKLAKKKAPKTVNEKAKRRHLWAIRIALAAAGVVLIVVGICNGGMKDVLLKAINICTQCIGLG